MPNDTIGKFQKKTLDQSGSSFLIIEEFLREFIKTKAKIA